MANKSIYFKNAPLIRSLCAFTITASMLCGCGAAQQDRPEDSRPSVVTITEMPEGLLSDSSVAEPSIPAEAESAEESAKENISGEGKSMPEVRTDEDLVYPEYAVVFNDFPDPAQEPNLDRDALKKAVGDLAYENNITATSLTYVRKIRSNTDGSAYVLTLNEDLPVIAIVKGDTYICTLDGDYEVELQGDADTSTSSATDNPVPDTFEIRNLPVEFLAYVADAETMRRDTYLYLSLKSIETNAVEILDDSIAYDGHIVTVLGACEDGEVLTIHVDMTNSQTTFSVG